MSIQSQAATGDYRPPFEWHWWQPYPSTLPLQWWSVPAQYVQPKTFADHIEIAKEAREAGKRMRRYRRIR